MEIITSIKSKADALVFAINKACENGGTFDKEKVDEIYDYIVAKVELPDTERDPQSECMDAIGGMFDKYTSVLSGLKG